MKKLVKKINFKIVGLLISLIIFEGLIFFISKLFISTPHLIGSILDEKTPFIPQFIYIYFAWYISLVVIPYYIYTISKDSFNKYIVVYIITTLICGFIFIAYPNTITRANITDGGLTNNLIKFIYFMDTPVNCMPSIHCLYSFLYIYAIIDTRKKSPTYIKIATIVFSILVVLSTLFIKQHIIYDAIASFIISIIVWIIVDKFKIYEHVNKIIKKDNEI